MPEVCFSISQTYIWCRLGIPQSSVLMTTALCPTKTLVCVRRSAGSLRVCAPHTQAGGTNLSSLVGADGIPVVTVSHACVEVGEIHTEGVLGDRVSLKSCSAHCRSAPRE